MNILILVDKFYVVPLIYTQILYQHHTFFFSPSVIIIILEKKREERGRIIWQGCRKVVEDNDRWFTGLKNDL